MHVLQCYQIPLTLATFVNCYRHLSSLRLSNQLLSLSDKIVTLVLVARVVSSCTYVLTLGYSSSMAGHQVTNQGSSNVWQMGGAARLIILLAHL
jgi:hypothetical protein